METIFHLAYEAEWDVARDEGFYTWSTRDETIEDVGFLHASFEGQVLGVAQRFYSDVDAPLVLLRIDAEALVDHGLEVRVEPGVPHEPNSEPFPHIYGGNLPTSVVMSAEPYGVPGSSLPQRVRQSIEPAAQLSGSTGRDSRNSW